MGVEDVVRVRKEGVEGREVDGGAVGAPRAELGVAVADVVVDYEATAAGAVARADVAGQSTS